MSMNINAQEGQKIKYSNPYNGVPQDQAKARKYLKLNEVYTIAHMSLDDYCSEVCVEEVAGVWFNTVMFEDVK